MITIYFNEACSKCNIAYEVLKSSGKEFVKINYLQKIPSLETLKSIQQKLNIPAEEMMRKQEQIFKELVEGKNLSGDECLEIIQQHPILLKRPIVIIDEQAYIVRPPLSIEEVLEKHFKQA